MSGPAQHLDHLPAAQARAALHRCCGARRWQDAMLAQRPFGDDPTLFDAAERIWWALAPADWREAFAQHPRIGARLDGPALSASQAWSRREQAGMASASEALRRALHDDNEAYEHRFGHVFLICASGLDARALHRALRERLNNGAAAELRIAAGEQAKITRLRLARLGRTETDPP